MDGSTDIGHHRHKVRFTIYQRTDLLCKQTIFLCLIHFFNTFHYRSLSFVIIVDARILFYELQR